MKLQVPLSRETARAATPENLAIKRAFHNLMVDLTLGTSGGVTYKDVVVGIHPLLMNAMLESEEVRVYGKWSHWPASEIMESGHLQHLYGLKIQEDNTCPLDSIQSN